MWTRYSHLSNYEFLAAMERQGFDSDALEYIRQEFEGREDQTKLIESLDDSLRELKTELSDYEDVSNSLDAAETRIEQLEAEIQNLEQESEYFQNRNTELHQEVNNWLKQIDDLENTISSLQELICDQNLKLEQLKGLKYA